jgi:hypothetical protein
MAEINYNFSSIYIILIAILYKTLTLDFGYFSPLINSLYQVNSFSIFLIINLLGLFVLLTRLKFNIYVRFYLE